jgi:hypothetical protein
MKKLLGRVTLAGFSALVLSSCGGGSGSSNQNVGVGNGGNTTTGVTAAGITTGTFSNVGGESCVVTFDMYSCSQTINGQNLGTNNINFTNLNHYCSNLVNSQLNVHMQSGQQIAQSTRQMMFQRYCGQTGINNGGGWNNGNNGQPQPGLKSFSCDIHARKGTLVYQYPRQQFSLLSDYAASVDLSIVRWHGFFKKDIIAKVSMDYAPAFTANVNSMDTIRLSAQTGDGTKATVEGFAGDLNKIEIIPQDTESGEVELYVSCSSSDAKVKPALTSAQQYACKGKEISAGKTKELNYVNKISDVISSGLSLTSSLYVSADQSASSQAGLINFAQTAGVLDSTVNVKSQLYSRTRTQISRYNYSLDLTCQPK